MRKITLYISQTVLQTIGVVLFVTAGMEFFVTLFTEISSINNTDYTFLNAVTYSLLMLPSQVYNLLPMAGFIGSLLALGHISAQNELLIIRAVGVSRWAITRAVMLAAIVVIVIVTWVGENYAFTWVQEANIIKHVNPTQKHLNNLWLSNGTKLIFVSKAMSNHVLKGVRVFDFKKGGVLKNVISSPHVIINHSNWSLLNSTKLTFGINNISQQSLPSYTLSNVEFQKNILMIVIKIHRSFH